MADARSRRHHAEIVERALPPFEELVTLHVALVFAVHVHLKGAGVAEFVDHHRVVDHQIDRVQGVDLLRVAAKRLDPVAHRGQIDHRRNAGEILHEHPRGPIGQFAIRAAAVGRPLGKGADVVERDGLAILEAQHVLQHHLERGGQAREIAQPRRLGGPDRVIGDGFAADAERLAGLGAVLSDCDRHGVPSFHAQVWMTFALASDRYCPPDQEACGAFVYCCTQFEVCFSPYRPSHESLSWHSASARIVLKRQINRPMRQDRSFMRHLLATLLAGSLLVSGAAGAGGRPVVVELFTSQGCASCPPADAFFQDLATREDVLALSLHVDYWDYIGWEDTFASPEHSARQRGYARAAGRKMVYTPQMVINGADHVVGTRVHDVDALIDRHRKAAPNGLSVRLSRDGARLHLLANAETPRDMPLVVQLARYLPEQTVTISRGENAGRTITYMNIVTELIEVAEWDTLAPLELVIDWPEGVPVAVILQYPDFGTIEAVARMWQ